MVLISIALVFLSFAICSTICSLLARVSNQLGLVDPVGTEPHKKHSIPIPNTGGIGIFFGMALPMTAAMILVSVVSSNVWAEILPDLSIHIEGIWRVNQMVGAILVAMAVMFFMGLIDDRKPIPAIIKLAVQFVVAFGLVFLGDMQILNFLGTRFGIPGEILSYTISALWIVVLTNAFNMLDNMNGLSAGCATIIAALYLIVLLIGGQWFVAALTAVLLGSTLGFLPHNFPKAKMFMGDAGSTILGLTLAIISIRTTYYNPGLSADPTIGPAIAPGQWFAALMPLMLFAIPLYDFTTVVVLRLLQGNNPFTGDHQHFSHRIVSRGYTQTRAVTIIWLCTLATGIMALMLSSLTPWQATFAATQTLIILTLLLTTETNTTPNQ